MDILYEESSVSKNAKKGQTIYKIVNIFYWIFLILSIFSAFFCITNIPFGSVGANATQDQQEAYAAMVGLATFAGFIAVSCISFTVILGLLKKRINVSFDYIFVSGELRIAKVFNINRRKLIVRLQPEDFLQVGDVDNAGYGRAKADPTVKEVIVTPNGTADEGKFFMYILAATTSGKRLYILECREELLINIVKCTKRGTLESDYVMQEKKAAQQ